MFNNKTNAAAAKAPTANTTTPEQHTCVIAPDTVIDGTIRCTESFRLDGKVIGDIICNKRFVMGEQGKVEGKVNCQESAISGRIEGQISVKGLLHLLSTAFLKGKIMASKMIVDEGAKYSGECIIGENN